VRRARVIPFVFERNPSPPAIRTLAHTLRGVGRYPLCTACKPSRHSFANQARPLPESGKILHGRQIRSVLLGVARRGAATLSGREIVHARSRPSRPSPWKSNHE
jgi:hypothetical protein